MAANVLAEVAYLLATSAEDRVYRRTLRSQLPEGRIRLRARGGVQNDIGGRFRDALRSFEASGWIAREGEGVVILDRGALWDFATR